ncbi:MAG: nucleoside-diphosphate sugar epimerase/dehydratase [Actinomycetota bacterium]
MKEHVLCDQTSRQQARGAARQAKGRARQRWSRTAMEVSYDTGAWAVCILAGSWLTGGRSGPFMPPAAGARAALALCLIAIPCGLFCGLYQSRHERGSFDEIFAVSMAACATGIFLTLLAPALAPGRLASLQLASVRLAAGATAFALLAMVGARYALFTVRRRLRTPASAAIPVIVFGAGAAGSQLIHSLLSQPGTGYRPVAVLDDDPAKRRLRIHGIPVLGDRTSMLDAAASTGAKVLVIAIAGASGTAIRDLTSAAERHGLIPKVIPSVRELLSDGARIEGVRDPRISDLLGRRPVQTDVAAVAKHFAGKRILVTGAGGSIGSELCRQLHRFGPAQLIMLDRDESALHAIQLALHGQANLDADELALADIRDPQRIMEIFARFRPHIVFHAAALKHLTLLERAPAEALKSNIWGTSTVLQAAAASGVESFVNISTDKAADPISVLGYSKRAAERLTAHMAGLAGGTYLSVRFGNVLGSRGSVLHTLSSQVAAGGPVTITHPDVTRFFMTADEAVQLVLQAAALGRAGEVLVLDMGEQMRIMDMARRLAASAPQPVEIVFTGLRPGEKLAEELLATGEVGQRPYHPLVQHVPVAPLAPDAVYQLDPDASPADLAAAMAYCVTGAPAAPDLHGPQRPWWQPGAPSAETDGALAWSGTDYR